MVHSEASGESPEMENEEEMSYRDRGNRPVSSNLKRPVQIF